MKRHVLLAAFAAATTLAQFPAHATATASASLINVNVELIDLDPSDGITPWVTFSGESETSASAWRGRIFETPTHEVVNSGAVSSTAETTLSSATSNTSPWGRWPWPYSFSVSTTANPGTTGEIGLDGSGANALSDWRGTFHLSGGTQMIISAGATASVGTTRPDTGYDWGDYSIGLGMVVGDGSFDWQRSDDGLGAIGVTATHSESRQLIVSVDNRDVESVYGILVAGVSVNNFSLISAVPEPETYAMMLAGLGAIGVMARRRQRQ